MRFMVGFRGTVVINVLYNSDRVVRVGAPEVGYPSARPVELQ